MNKEERQKQFELDKSHAEKIKSLGIVKYPMDIPSLWEAVYGDGKVDFLSDGYQWLDKPHRVAFDAMEEIRALRAEVLSLKNQK